MYLLNEVRMMNKLTICIYVVIPICLLMYSEQVFGAQVEGQVRQLQSPQNPISQARVTLFDISLSFFKEVRTDGQGQFSIANVSAGTYQLGVSALGFEYQEITIAVEASNVTNDFFLGPETDTGQWTIIGSTEPELSLSEAPDIAILMTDGKIFYCHDTVDPLVFDPVTGTKFMPPASPAEQHCFAGSLLQDGRIIAIGGHEGSNFRDAIPWVKTYNPATNSWQWLADMQLSQGRYYPGLARLADGSLLVIGGGMAPNAARTNTCELFDLVTETWSFTGSMVNPTDYPPLALLYTGEVLATWSPPQLYNPATGLWRLTGNFNQPNRLWPGHSDHSLVLLADGRALAVGIRKGPDNNTVMGEIYDPVSETWSLTSNPGLVRQQPEVTQLPDGKILVAAGEAEEPSEPNVLGVVKWCDLYDPATDTWQQVAGMNWFREYHAVTLLVPDGRVVMTSGTRIKFQYGPASADIEAFSPPYLFRGIRPQITSISTNQPLRGSQISLTIVPQTTITSIVLMGTEAHTHWADGGIPRRIVLPVQQNGSDVTVTVPKDSYLIPLGHYMLFAMVDDIPSIASMIQVKESTAGDLNGSGETDFVDFAALALFWSNTNCDLDNFWCNGADFIRDGELNHDDLAEFITYWLIGVE
jgi:hypothetical protein